MQNLFFFRRGFKSSCKILNYSLKAEFFGKNQNCIALLCILARTAQDWGVVGIAIRGFATDRVLVSTVLMFICNTKVSIFAHHTKKHLKNL